MRLNKKLLNNFFIVIALMVMNGCFTTSSVDYPDPLTNPSSPKMLAGDWVPDDPHKIDFNKLPLVKSQYGVVSDVRVINGVNQHNYLTYYEGRFWAMWSDGPGVEDRVGQRVAFSISTDGLKWSDKKYITPYPPGSESNSSHYNTRTEKGFRYISRGFWQREDELLALVSKDEADGFFGQDLELRAFRLNPKNETWEDIGVVYDNAINNFPPKLLPNGEWMMTRRSYDRDVYMLTGGVESFNQWETHPVTSYEESELIAEEPYWWVLPDKNILALFRDNAKGGFLFRAFSTDLGRTWSKPVITDFPDARSKFSGLQLSDGRYVLVSNPDPKKRDPLILSISDDGIVFNKMGYLIGGRQVDYPHVIEHNGYLLVAFSGKKQSVEILKIKIGDIDNLKMPTKNEIIKDPNKMDVNVIQKMVEFGDIKLSYKVRPGNGPTLVLIPGSFSDATQWNEIIPHLRKDLNLILIEVRGRGQSWPPPVNGTMEQLAKDVIVVADNEKLENFFIGGHSIGGMISKEVGRCCPDRVKGVIAIEGWTHWTVIQNAFPGVLYSTLKPEVRQKGRTYGALGAVHQTDEQRDDFRTIWKKWERGNEFLANTSLPVIELYGDRGNKQRPSLEQLQIPERPNIEVCWIKDVSHKMLLERPEKVASVIVQFIEKIESSKE